jgi:hypothetical protein
MPTAPRWPPALASSPAMPNSPRASPAWPAGWRSALRPGDRVGLVMKNCPEYAEAMFACWHAGLVAVPINAKLHPRELEYILGHSGCRLCFATPDLHSGVAGLTVPGMDSVVEVGGSAWDALFTAPIEVGAAAADRSGLAVLHQRHHRPAQGRHADHPQPDGGGAQLLCRRRCHRAGRRHHPCRADVARLGLLHAAARRPRRTQRHAGIGRLRAGRDLRAAARASRRDDVRRADHGQAPGRAPRRRSPCPA